MAGSRSSMWSSFHRQGGAYQKERFVIFKEDLVGGRARVTLDEERVFRRLNRNQVVEILCVLVVRICVRERSLYLIRSLILSHCM